MKKFLDELFSSRDEWYCGLLAFEIIFQLLGCLYMFSTGVGDLGSGRHWQSTIYMHNFFQAHWWIMPTIFILFIVGDVAMLFAENKYRENPYYNDDKAYFECIFYLGCNIIFAGSFILTPIAIILLIMTNASKFFAFLCECIIGFRNKLSIKNMMASYKKKSPEKYKQTIIDEYNKLVGIR